MAWPVTVCTTQWSQCSAVPRKRGCRIKQAPVHSWLTWRKPDIPPEVPVQCCIGQSMASTRAAVVALWGRYPQSTKNSSLYVQTNKQTNGLLIIKTFFVFHPILMKLGEVVVPICTTTSPSFIKIRWKTKKFSLCIIDHLTEVSSVKVLLRSC